MSDVVAGLDLERLSHIAEHLESQYLSPGKLPCAVTLVARHGQLVWQHAQGMIDVERKVPVTLDSLFRI